ncbi:MAG: UvrD-helicase domain-containing protein, partial [Gammaproteobacteria bacterium]|nr:UvrD-helicase domain-containing protein [Gammaproteobacteria bacterium]
SSKFYFEKFEVMWPQLEQLLTASNQSVLDNSFTLLLKSEIDSKTAKAQLGKHDFLDDDIFTLADELWALQQQITKNFTASVLRDVVVFATDQVERVKLQQQSLTYDDQMLRLHQALTLGDDFLATTICKKFPVVLIDEFQDTNAIQYEIFKTIYYQKNEISLILIGDPKQAIYSFRGGDVFTYMQAKTDVNDEIYTLNTNWRSTQRLISGLNYFFNHRDDTFIYSDAMPYDDVVAGSDKELSLLVNQQIEAPISIWDVPEDLQTNEASELINSELANTVANLLNRANKGEVNIGENSVKPADIAILVRTNNEGLAIAKALKERGINSINIGKDKVLQSEAAKGLLLFLKGIAQANDHQQVRNMLASPLIALNPTQINSIINIEIEWLNWLTNVKQLNEIWQKEGFIVMFQAMLNTLKITTNILLKVDAERQMTNMLHCSELLQKESKTHATPEALCYWLQSQIRANKNELNNQSDEHELRLDSDAELVKIVTVHKSKGLEYSIVFVPYLWRCKPIGGKEPVYNYHDEQQNNVLDFAIAGSTQAQLYNDKERLAEDMRLLYVALTRAKSKLYIVTNRKIKTSYQSALNFLLHPYQSATSLNTQLANINKLKEKNILKQDLIDFVEQSEKLIDITQLEPSKTIKLNSKSTLEANNIQVKTFTGDIYFDWTISSFSRMTRDIHQVAHGGKKEVTNDAILNFKGSGEVGTFLHLILEHLDFSADIKQQTSALFDQYAPQYHLVEESTKGIVVNWLDDVIHCALNESGFCLADLSPNHCLDELEFDFSIKYMNIQKLNAYLEQRTGQNQSLLLSNNFKGMMTGFVDLIFVKDNQYYVVDYKSNFLGTSLSDYTQEKLNQAIIDRRYDLQYLIYSLALHRFLRLRIKDYQYEKHFGGVYYLFLRAMRKSSGAKFGVFFDKPTAEEINLLDEVIFECV